MLKIKKFLLLFVLCGYSLIANATEQYKLSDLTILVPSCDKYSGLWTPFTTLLFKNWPSLNTYNKDISIVFISNSQKLNNPRIENINIVKEISWSDNMLTALKSVQTKYVMILLEDYLINKNMNEKQLSNAFNFLKTNNGAYLQLASFTPATQTTVENYPNNISKFSKHSKYRTSLQACIWDTETLTWLLKPGESPWKFEIDGSVRSEGILKPFFVYTSDDLISHLNAAQNSIINQNSIDYLKQQNIPFNKGNLAIDSEFRSICKIHYRRFASFITNNILIYVKKALIYLGF